jgi:ABC-type transporter Mla maintaining outer membrane lipid asymmetry ATPase subunit MlaF
MDVPRGSALLCVKNLRVVLGNHVIIDGVSLELHAREVLLLLGRSGSGKTVLVKAALGFLPVAAGVVTCQGAEVRSALAAAKMRERLVLVHQDPALFDERTALDNVALPLQWRRGGSRAKARAQALQALRRVGADDVAETQASDLSAGVRKLVSLARALAHEPLALFLDEPTTGLDAAAAQAVGRTCMEISALGTALWIVTHDVEPFQTFATHVGVLAGGRLLEHGHAQELWRAPGPALRQLLDASPDGPLSSGTTAEAE